MKKITLLLALGLVTQFSFAQNIIEGELPKDQFVYQCPPCGCELDGKYVDAPGVCHACNMDFVPTYPGVESQLPPTKRLKAGILIFDHADIMDVTGPWSVLVHNGVQVVTFAKSKDPVNVGMSMMLTPDFTLDNLPEMDILIFPGSGLAETNPGDPAIQSFIQQRKDAKNILFSVCSGAFFLAEAGLLDGKDATTFAGLIPRLRNNYPEINVLNDVKYTDNGQTVTTAGLSSGIDGTFHVISKFRGEGAVQDVANHMEYPWARKDEYARTQLADNFIRGIKSVIETFSKKYISSKGNRNNWTYQYLLSGQLTSAKVLEILANELKKMQRWKQDQINTKTLSGTISNATLGDADVTISISKSGEDEMISITAKRITGDSTL